MKLRDCWQIVFNLKNRNYEENLHITKKHKVAIK
jgi:hypothetical protein